MLAPNGPHNKTPPKKRRVNLGDVIAQAVQPAVQKAQQVQHNHPTYATNTAARRAVQQGVQNATQTARNIERVAGGHAPTHVVVHGAGKTKTRGGNGILGNIGAELNGTGTITAGAIPGLADLAAAGINLPRTITRLAPGALRAPLAVAEGPLGIVTRAAPHLLGNAARDAVEIPGEAIPSLYYALKPLAHGDVGSTVKRFGQPYLDLINHPGKSVMEHPLGSAMLAVGAEGAVGRGLGYAARRGALGRGLQESASLRRASAVNPNSTFEARRPASRDIFVNAAQKARDSRKAAKADAMRQEANTLEAHAKARGADPQDTALTRAHSLRQEANKIDPRIATTKHLNRSVDATESIDDSRTRQARNQAVREVDQIMGKMGRKASAGLSPIAQGIVHASSADLRAYSTELRAEFDRLAQHADKNPAIKGRLRRNEQLRAGLDRVANEIDSGKIDAQHLLRIANTYNKYRNSLETGLTEAGILNPKQAARRRLLPGAIRDQTVAYDAEAGLFSRPGTKATHPDEINYMLARGEAEDAAMRYAAAQRAVGMARNNLRVAKASKSAARISRAQDALDRAEVTQAQMQGRLGARTRVLRTATSKRPPRSRRAVSTISNQELAASLKAPDRVQEPAFLSLAPNARGARNYQDYPSQLPNVRAGTFHGKSVKEGTYSTHPDVFRESAAKAVVLREKAKSYTGRAKKYGAHDSNGKLIERQTFSEIKDLADRLNGAGAAHEWRPVRANPFAGSHDTMLQHLNDAAVDPEQVQVHANKAIADALHEASTGDYKGPEGPWNLWPKPVIDRFYEHQQILGAKATPKALQKLNSIFRRVVLFTPHFVEMNQIEASFRGALNGMALPGGRAYFLMRNMLKTLDQIDPAAATEVRHQIGSGQMGFAGRMNLHRPIEGEGKISRRVQAAKNSEAGHRLVHAWDKANHTFFDQINGTLERQFRTAQAGKFVKDYLLPRAGLRLQHDAMQQAVEGLRGTPEQLALGEYVNRAYGKYNHFSPEQRKWLVLYTPFGAWFVNSVYFLSRTLPADHPVFTSLLASANQASEDWRKLHGLTQFNAKGVRRLPGFLQNSIPGAGDSHLRTFSQGTPFGVASDIGSGIKGQFLPSVSGITGALAGQTYTGRDIRGANGQPGDVGDFAKAALGEAFGISVPGATLYQQQKKAGGSVEHRARRIFDPFMFTQGKKQQAQATPQGSAPPQKRRPRTTQDELLDIAHQVNSAARSGGTQQVLQQIAAEINAGR
jgi:hypothetical protein